MTRLRLPLLTSLAALTAVVACSKGPAERTSARAGAPVTSTPTGTAAGSDVVAEIDGRPVLAADLDRRAESRLARLRQEEYEIRKQALDELIWERLLETEAARQKVSRDALLAREVDGKAAEPSQSQIDSIYEQNKGRFAGQSREDAVARIRMVLAQRARQERRAAYESALRQQAKVVVRLPVPRTPVEIPAGAPSTGPQTAPVTIVEFTDYQCPFCHRAQSVVDEVLTRYKGKVRFVHRDFPLEGHPGAFPAARAARCAGEQGRFWEYHRSLMTVQRHARRRRPEEAGRGHRARRLEVRGLRGLEAPRRGDPGVVRAGRGPRRDRHAGLLRQRPDDLRRPADRGLHGGHRLRAGRSLSGSPAAAAGPPLFACFFSGQAGRCLYTRRLREIAQEVAGEVAD